ncbi:GNAT family N-acetyltransferase [Streptomyces sp. NBC_01498]|uniref:GNAT family N-acetyltransferase n=1 Tax=Streptomyces sp. NBC_01498 TaxID=2975870 RepID=UPI002E7BF21E|nr:GNAT family N-acetyltransferase [Streptomyces sp. NBC_01498]WTL27242.1 GNAT family N-acetyltransferase [Streptomyces sp. NBC_01498]
MREPAVPVIRVALPADDEALGQLDHDTWSTLHAVTPRPGPAATFFDERHRPRDYVVAEVDGRIAGYLRLAPPSSLAAHAHVREIQGLAVHAWARRRGVARLLLRAAVDRARAEGALRITLRVLGYNGPARALYEAEGFAVEGVRPGELFLDGQYVDDVFMGRSLDL